MDMPDLTPAARELAREYVRQEASLAAPFLDEILACLKDTCRAHLALRAVRDENQRKSTELAFSIIAQEKSPHEGASDTVVPFRII